MADEKRRGEEWFPETEGLTGKEISTAVAFVLAILVILVAAVGCALWAIFGMS